LLDLPFPWKGRPMTTYEDTDWDEARSALGRVSQVLQRTDARQTDLREELRGIEGYREIPEPVRDAVENLSPEERDVVNRLMTTLAENRFFLENNMGRMEPY
jgi:hypothetical protein